MEWEQIDKHGFERRARVPFGWLFRIDEIVWHEPNKDFAGGDGWDWRPAVTFIFDPFHCWKLKKGAK
jgi:hypothetical protein